MDTSILQALQLNICSLPGGRDKEQRPILLVNVPIETNVEQKDQFILVINYLIRCFRSSSLRNGITIVLNAIESSWRITRTYIRYISENVSKDVIAFLLVLRPDVFWDKQRVEKCIKSQNEISIIYIPRSRLIKFIDTSQIPVELGGGCILTDHEKWMQNQMRLEEWKADLEYVLVELKELQQRLINNCLLRTSDVENALNVSMDISESTKMLAQAVIDSGKELLFLYEENIKKWKNFNGNGQAPQDLLDTASEIDHLLSEIDSKQELIDTAWVQMEKSFETAHELTSLEEGVTKVTNWILTVGEELANSQQRVGFDVASAEELRLEHEILELQCWDTYGHYAEISYKINSFPFINDSIQHRDLLSQKAFMDFVCRSFATRLEKRRNLLITSLRLFRLISEYFDRTSEVYEALVMGNQIDDFNEANIKLKKLIENQQELDAIETELVKEGEKLRDMLSMPVKNALGGDVPVNYEEEITNINDILDATRARKNIFTDSVELQKLTLEKIIHISSYERDTEEAIQWLNDLFQVVLESHSQVGCNVQEIQNQKEDLQSFQQTVKCTYNFGCQLLNASLTLRQSCKLSIEDHTTLSQKLRFAWQRIESACQEQMTRLRVSAVFHRSVDEYCVQIQDLRDAVSGMPLEDPIKKRERVRQFFVSREHLLMEVGRMVRLGRLLRTRLRESLYPTIMADESNPTSDQTSQQSQQQHHINLNEGNATAIESISERLSEVAGLAEQLDMALRGAQQDCALATPPASSSTINANIIGPIKKIFDDSTTSTTAGVASPTENWYAQNSEKKPTTPSRFDDVKSDDEFLTASECTVQSRSSSFHTTSECGALSPWWELDRSVSPREDLHKEKMVIAVGLPELPNPKSVLKPSPEVPPGKIVHEVTETTHLKVQHCHTLDVSSYVLTSETVKDGKNLAGAQHQNLSTVTEKIVHEDRVKYIPEGREVIVPVNVETSVTTDANDLLLKQFKEVSCKPAEPAVLMYEDNNNAWCKYYHTYVTQETIKGCL